MKLRFATAEDAEMLEAVHAKAFDASWSSADISRLMHILGGFALIAEEPADDGVKDGEAVGFILTRTVAGEAEILTLAVAPWARRHGVGAALVQAAAEEAIRRGARTLYLEVAASNAAALGLYEGSGFERAGLRRAYYTHAGAPAEDALVLRRLLNTALG
jgi:ribosomal-protein-alanine N-acetyltransferase